MSRMVFPRVGAPLVAVQPRLGAQQRPPGGGAFVAAADRFGELGDEPVADRGTGGLAGVVEELGRHLPLCGLRPHR